MFGYQFFQNALLGILLVSAVCAIVGTYIVSRRMVFISGGITHACFGGLGMGYWLGVSPMLMAALFAVGGSLGVDALSRSRRVRRDTAIAVIWSLGMALGVMFIFMSSGYVPDLNAFLFGNVLTITRADLWLFALYCAAVAAVMWLCHPVVLAVGFDSDFARTRHLPVRWVNAMMTVVVALGIVLTIRMIGIMLLMSMMSLPQMTAERYRRRYFGILWLSMAIAVGSGVGGLVLAYWMDVPASATIVLLLVAAYCLTGLERSWRERNVERRSREA